MKKITIYTTAAKKHNTKGLTLSQTKKIIKEQHKKTPIYIYDITHNPNKQQHEKIFVNDHINKTGKNILRNTTNQITFYDLTRIYKQHKKGIITSCLGKKYSQNKTTHQHPSTTICNISIYLKSQGYDYIYGILINEI